MFGALQLRSTSRAEAHSTSQTDAASFCTFTYNPAHPHGELGQFVPADTTVRGLSTVRSPAREAHRVRNSFSGRKAR